jgi:hypothetical protein
MAGGRTQKGAAINPLAHSPRHHRSARASVALLAYNIAAGEDPLVINKGPR